MKKRLLLMGLLGAFLLLALVACGRSTPTPTPTPPPPTPTPTTPPTNPTVQPRPTTQLEAYYEALAALPAYSATLVMTYEPEPGSDAKPFRVTFEEKRAQGKPERQWVHIHGLSSVDPNMKRNDATYTFIGDETWFTAGEERFYSTKSQPRRRLFLSPEDFIPATTELKDMGPAPQPINGQKVHHYQIADGKQLFGDGPDQPVEPELLQGDVWVSTEGNYIVRYIIKVHAKDLKLRPDPTPGTLTVEYNVVPLKPEEVKITPPEDALTLEELHLPGFEPGTFPVPKDAEIVSLIQTEREQLLAYNVLGKDPKEVFEDLKSKLTSMGWKENEEDHQETADYISSSWSKGKDTIMILVSPMRPHGGTQVMVRNAPLTSEQ